MLREHRPGGIEDYINRHPYISGFDGIRIRVNSEDVVAVQILPDKEEIKDGSEAFHQTMSLETLIKVLSRSSHGARPFAESVEAPRPQS